MNVRSRGRHNSIERPGNGHGDGKPRTRRTSRAANEKNVFEIIGELANKIPARDLQALPKDLSINLDHYLYGVPKVEPWRPV